ncbi:M15 family metallopeptidase [Microbacterium album]|uniref:D-alanyl-D-alanine carboxypeptidase-like core domain-containing protein n=1 Tax=Microbacterium album TaxID=2053191 RepID=A0A917ICG3_9MICO|nr:M15 family metallopeptidase [Microbacterium album]GGH34265.1 hypothetical protein GCM10010921_01840 [Microbacterium album]
MGGTDTTVRIDGWPVAPGTAHAFQTRLKPAFERAFPGITLHVYSGYRSYADQEAIFRERYRAGAHSPYGDYRWWNGVRWGRVSGEGTVAVPGTSNHQSGHALDVRDSGRDAGVTVAGNARSNWIRQNARDHGFDPAGYGFAEPWHIEYTGDPWAAPAAVASVQTATAAFSEEDPDMPIHIRRERDGHTWTVVPGLYIKHHPNVQNGNIAGYLTTGSTKRPDFRSLNDADLSIAMWDLGFPELKGDIGKLPRNGGYVWAERAAATTWVKDRLGGSVLGNAPSISALLDRIAKKLGA